MNLETGEIKSQTVFMGDFPLMTDRATFIINGTERVVVSQLVRSPGVYFERSTDKTSDRELVSAKIIPSRGAWLEFDVDKNDVVSVRIDRKRKQPATALLLAMGMSVDDIRERFGRYPSMMGTLDKEIEASRSKSGTITREEALVDIFKKLRPGEPQSAEAGENLLNNLYFNSKRYDLAKVGRYKVNKAGRALAAGSVGAHAGGHRRHHRVPGAAARGSDRVRRFGSPGAGGDRRHRPLRQPSAAHRG